MLIDLADLGLAVNRRRGAKDKFIYAVPLAIGQNFGYVCGVV